LPRRRSRKIPHKKHAAATAVGCLAAMLHARKEFNQ